ncbi:hypothetical protein SAMN04244548_01215 [Paracoccus pantotrophus]|nr:hypothetical protein SAMN04244548_01215 [Paracoccus pantotrophus]
MGGAPVSLPRYTTVAAAVAFEGPIRDFLRVIQNDDATRDTALSEWLKQTVNALPGIIDGAVE